MSTFERDRSTAFMLRLLIGVLQGAALYLLTEMVSNRTWPFQQAWVYPLLFLFAGLIPFLLHAGVGTMRRAALSIWCATAGAIIAATVAHTVWRDPSTDPNSHLWLAFPLTVVLFIGHHLVAASDRDGRLIAKYESYFDTGWRNGVQLALCLAFTGAFWLLLWLGASLFELINIGIVTEIITKKPFVFLATSIVFALAVHISDARFSLVNGARTIALVLLSWLLPVMTLLTLAFLATLIFTGLKPLWETGNATAILVLSGGVLITLINAAYQDGTDEHLPVTALRISARLAALALAPIAVIAFYSIWLRVAQYGLTPQRVLGLAIVAVGSVYAAGYSLAAIWPARWMKPLELTNVVAALFSFALLVSLMTSIADPVRISVNDQVARLQTGSIAPDKFDFDFLRFDAGLYGLDALKILAANKSTPAAKRISELATAALARTARISVTQPGSEPVTPEQIKAKISVLPAGTTLPDSFYSQDWPQSGESPALCALENGSHFPCEAIMADIDQDSKPEILLRRTTYEINVYKLSAEGRWFALGRYAISDCDFNDKSNFSSGTFKFEPPSTLEVEHKGRRYRLIEPCPSATPAPPK